MAGQEEILQDGSRLVTIWEWQSGNTIHEESFTTDQSVPNGYSSNNKHNNLI
jgi:hypothetical protein